MSVCVTCCANVFCCECNCLIFPAPNNSFGWFYEGEKISGSRYGSDEVNVELLSFTNESSNKVPFLKLSSEKSRQRNQVCLYFHGNAQDVFYSVDFIAPMVQKTGITFYCMEYPTYSCYEVTWNCFISNKIKHDVVPFYKEIQRLNEGLKPENIFIMGRSIGSGPASYLASQVQCERLILISPFDTIREVAKSFVGCIGCIVKNHFDNLESIKNHRGDLLVIHGRVDEVIHFEHGQRLVALYEQSHRKNSTFIQPARMSHNLFDFDGDIIRPIDQFLNFKS